MKTNEEIKRAAWQEKVLKRTEWTFDEFSLLIMCKHLKPLDELTPFKIRHLNRILDQMNDAYETDAYGNFG